jgi:enoyl-CoA hydratase/carnithine racemase
MLPAAGGTQSLTRVVGPSEAVAVVALADDLTATSALGRGVISMVADDPDGAAAELAATLASRDPAVIRTTKRCLRAALDLPLDAGLAVERRLALQAAAR